MEHFCICMLSEDRSFCKLSLELDSLMCYNDFGLLAI